MSDAPATIQNASNGQAGPAVATRAAPPRVDRLPPFHVLLHNDDVNDMLYVVETIVMLTPHGPERAIELMLAAHRTGKALVLTAHRERAELVAEQFISRGLTATIAPAG